MGFFVVASMGSNRTFMELKLYILMNVRCPTPSSNRTFMELKCTSRELNRTSPNVLIVPLWN